MKLPSFLLAALILAIILLIGPRCHASDPALTIGPASEIVATHPPTPTPIVGPLPASPTLTATATDALPVEDQNLVLGFLLKLIGTHPWIATVIAFMGICRTGAKPIFSFIHFVVDTTPSKSDDGLLNSVCLWFTVNPIGRSLAFLIDWFTSIKIVAPGS